MPLPVKQKIDYPHVEQVELKRKDYVEKQIQTSPHLLHKNTPVMSDEEHHSNSTLTSPEHSNPDKSGLRRNTMSQNYPGVVSSGIGKFVLVALNDPKQYSNIVKLIDRIIEGEGLKEKFTPRQVADELKDYVNDKIEGRVTINRCKVNNRKDIAKVFACQEEDLPIVKLTKMCLVGICDHFFEKEEFKEWVESCKAKEESKTFLLENRVEIHRIFADPENYKPKFKNYLIPAKH